MELERLDPQAAARLNAADTTRIARALEVVLSTGRIVKDWQSERMGGIGGEVELRPLILLPPRDWLYARCNARFAAMVDQGAVAEVERLLARKLDPSLPVMRAIGVAEIPLSCVGETTREAMIAACQQSTRRYAKRQYTWFAHQPPCRLAVLQPTVGTRCSVPGAGAARAKASALAADGTASRRRHRPHGACRLARRHPRLWQPGPRPGAQPQRQRHRPGRRASPRLAERDGRPRRRARRGADRGGRGRSGPGHDARAR